MIVLNIDPASQNIAILFYLFHRNLTKRPIPYSFQYFLSATYYPHRSNWPLVKPREGTLPRRDEGKP